jgi:DHA3 family tetracycline resistance protein-like MFS transporter
MSAYRLFLFVSGVAALAGDTAFTLNLVYQSQVVGLDPVRLVLVGTLMEVVCLVAQVPTGVVADLYGRRLSVVAGYLLMGAGLLVWGLVPTFPGLLVANVVWAVGAVCVDGAQEAWAADEIGEEHAGRAFVRAGQVAQVGTVLGIVAAVLLGGIDLAWPILAAAVVTLALGLLLAVVMPEDGWSPTPADDRTTWRSMRDQVAAGGRAVRRSPVLGWLLAGTVFVGLSSEGFDRLGQPYLLDEVGLPATLSPPQWFGVFAVLAALGAVLVTGLTGRLVDALRPRLAGLLSAGITVVGAAATVGFGLAGAFWPAVGAYLVASLAREAARPVLATWLIANTTSGTRATVLSMEAQVDAVGQILGGPPAGWVGQRVSVGAGITTSGLFLLPAVLFFALATGRSRERASRQQPPRRVAPD